MHANTAKISAFALALGLLLLSGAQPARAQAVDDDPIKELAKKPVDARSLPTVATPTAEKPVIERKADTTGFSAIKEDTIAVVPWLFVDSTKGAAERGRDVVNSALSKVKLTQIHDASLQQLVPAIDRKNRDPQLPAPQSLLEVGRKLNVRYVLAGKAKLHSRSLWISLGPKTKSTAFIDVIIVDVKENKVVLNVHDLAMDDTAKESTLQTLGSLFVSSMFTVLSGGPKTPHEQRAVTLGILKALEPFLTARLNSEKVALGSAP